MGMEPLDLSKGHPRAARAELAGVTFLPRSIDKFRAALPGGSLSGYSLDGFTGRMLEALGISADAFQAAVAAAHGDDDIASYVREHAVAGGAENGTASCSTASCTAEIGLRRSQIIRGSRSTPKFVCRSTCFSTRKTTVSTTTREPR